MAARRQSSPAYRVKRKHGKSAAMSAEEKEIFVNLQHLGSQLSLLHDQYDFLTDPALIDGCIYEIKAVQMKYKYYVTLCRRHRLFGIPAISE